MRFLVSIVFILLFPIAAVSQQILQTDNGPVKVEKMISGLEEPWAIAFLPDGSQLVTLREGRLLFVSNGKARPVQGVPRVVARGQGGLLDVVVAKDFASSREIFLSYSEPRRGGSATALAVAKLSQTGARLTNIRTIFQVNTPTSGGRHFGSRIVEAKDGSLFLTLGDRGNRPSAQDLYNHNGSVIRVLRNGGTPTDNPFVGKDGAPEIYSYGHRNIQGAALDGRGRLWTVEHGAAGGDEINRPEAGKNYGWPVISYGRHYTGGKIGEGTAKAGMEQPALYWDPSIAPSGMMIYSGKLFGDWAGQIFVGSLKFDMISRSVPKGGKATEVERLFQDEFQRVRDIREAPDGSIWFLSVGEGAAYRITPA